MKNVNIKTRWAVVAVAALAIATGAIATGPSVPAHHFPVGVNNQTTTPEVPVSPTTPFTRAGEVQVECGHGSWRTVEKGASWYYAFFDCYPSTASDPFAVTYKARLADDANGNPVYHTGTVTISCTRGSDDPAAPNATSAEFSLTGSGTGITVSNVICNGAQNQQPAGD